MVYVSYCSVTEDIFGQLRDIIRMHKIQISILEALLFKKRAKFQELNIKRLPTDQFNYHLQQLVKQGLLLQVDGNYVLTSIGMDVAGRIDTKSHTPVIQPKIGVALFLFRNLGGEKQVLLGRRLKDQSSGLWGPFTEKVRFGEKAEETIKRCLQFETGLTAIEWKYVGVTRYMNPPEIDVIHLCFEITRFSGVLLKETKESHNEWVDLDVCQKLNLFIGLQETLKKISLIAPFYSHL